MSTRSIDARDIQGPNGLEITGTQLGSKRGLDFVPLGSTPSIYDDIVLSYTSGNLTGVVYKLDGVTLTTLTLSYTNGDLTRVQYS